MKDNELGIYIHIPFCKKKCYYCDFVSFAGITRRADEYFEAMEKDIEGYNLKKYNVTTIYIGGGTPSWVNSKYIEQILLLLKNKIENNQTKWEDIEITIEINPGTVTKQKLEKYKQLGINRLSIGLQSSVDRILKDIGRIHTYQDFEDTYSLARDLGFDNINVDLMIGLPNQKIQNIKETVDRIISLSPEHISVYSLILEEGTRLEEMVSKKIVSLPNEETERNMYWFVKNKLELNGYEHYEISNFSKKGKHSKHNMNCWKQKQYIGIGLAACSFLDKKRYGNENDFENYIYGVSNGFEKIIMESLNDKEERKEYMMLGLRKIKGVSISEFKEKFIDNPIIVFRKELEKLVGEELVVIDGDFIRLTNKGLDFANLVWEEFV